MNEYIENKVYENLDFSENHLTRGDYEECTFIRCDFTANSFNHFAFIECTFTGCNLSNVTVESAGFRDVKFSGCKLTGIDFSLCNDSMISLDFEDCVLDYVSLARLHLKKTSFRSCSMIRAFFDDADLSEAHFSNCNLENAVFIGTKLEKADLSSSYNYIIDPEKNKIKKARFSASGLPGLLANYDIMIV